MVGTVTDVDVQDSEDGTQYVMIVKQKDNQGGESSKERFDVIACIGMIGAVRLFLIPWCFKIHRMFSRVDDL